MADVRIREYGLTRWRPWPMPLPQEPGLDQAPIALSGASAQSAAFASTTALIAIEADADFHFAVGSDPEATTEMQKRYANVVYHLDVKPGDNIAVIAAA